MSTLGAQLKASAVKLTDRLRATHTNKITESIKNKLLQVLKESDEPVWALEISLTELGIDPAGMKSEGVNGIKSPIHSMLDGWAKAENLHLQIYWTHPDCSFCETCGPGCKPKTIFISSKESECK